MYKYIAKTKNGQVIKGEVNAASRDKAVSMISAMGLFVLSVEEKGKTSFSLPGRISKKQISIILSIHTTDICPDYSA